MDQRGQRRIIWIRIKAKTMISHFGSVAYKSVLQVTLGHFCIDRYLPEYTVCMQTLEMQLPGNKEETWMKLEDMEEKPELDGGG